MVRAGQEVATALSLLSDAAFKLYVFLGLNVDQQSVTDALEELCRREVCVRHPDADSRLAPDRLCIEIRDRFWPYDKPPVEEFGVDQNCYVQQVRQMLLHPACVHAAFSGADERLAAILYRRGVTLVHQQRAIGLGCARKYVALLNATDKAPMFVTSLNYFAALVEGVAEMSMGEDYWKHVQHKVMQLERMWKELRPPGNPRQETK